MRQILESIEGEYRRYKTMTEKAVEQLTDEQLIQLGSPGGNSVATLMWHISGNLASRFTDFLETDGEKPWRKREEEFLPRNVTRGELLGKWEWGWAVLFESLSQLSDSHLYLNVKIRGVTLAVHDALHRSLAHTSYHAGQVVFLAKAFVGDNWHYLTIPPGGSAAYNANPVREKPPRTQGEVQGHTRISPRRENLREHE